MCPVNKAVYIMLIPIWHVYVYVCRSDAIVMCMYVVCVIGRESTDFGSVCHYVCGVGRYIILAAKPDKFVY